MKIFYGIIEDRQDPLKIGRVRVRCHGIHTDRKDLIATPDLPWAQVLLPTTSAGLSGFGTQHGLVEGSSVWGFFRDGEKCNQPVVVGVSAGIPQSGYKGQEGKDADVKRSITKGFNDPRKLTGAVKDKDGKDISSYDGTPDGVNPTHSPTRGHGLTTGLDSAPIGPKSREINYDGTGSKIINPTITADDLPYYPLYTDDSDLSSFARGEGDYAGRDTSDANGIKSKAKPVYPYNKVTQTESGHVIEIDDTLGVERIAVEHRSGTFHEIHPDGSQVTRIVNDNYTVVCKDDEVWIGGKVNVKILGDATFDVGGDAKINVAKTTEVDSKGNLSVIAPEISLNAGIIKLNS